MNKLKKIISYVIPNVIETTSSKINPYIEIVYLEGKYMLNTQNANYSYGTLYTSFEKVFNYIGFEKLNIENALILGFGGGCTVKLINEKYNKNAKITGVEIDEKIIELSKKYFDIEKFQNLDLICSDAYDYALNCKTKFDFIIIDAFIDLRVPENIVKEDFIAKISVICKSGGIVLFKIIKTPKSDSEFIRNIEKIYGKYFVKTEIIKTMTTGRCIIAYK